MSRDVSRIGFYALVALVVTRMEIEALWLNREAPQANGLAQHSSSLHRQDKIGSVGQYFPHEKQMPKNPRKTRKTIKKNKNHFEPTRSAGWLAGSASVSWAGLITAALAGQHQR